MFSLALRDNFVFFVGVALMCQIFCSHQTAAYPNLLKKFKVFSTSTAARSTENVTTLSNNRGEMVAFKDQELKRRQDVKAEKTVNSTSPHEKLKRILSQRQMEKMFGSGVDTATSLLTVAENVLNGKTDVNDIDRYMSSFNDLFNSRGMTALNIFYTLFANFWVNFDAIGMFVRTIDGRIRDSIAEEETRLEEAENNLVGDTIDALDEANQRLADLKTNLKLWICREIVAVNREGLALEKRRAEGRQLDCATILRRAAFENAEDKDSKENFSLGTQRHGTPKNDSSRRL